MMDLLRTLVRFGVNLAVVALALGVVALALWAGGIFLIYILD